MDCARSGLAVSDPIAEILAPCHLKAMSCTRLAIFSLSCLNAIAVSACSQPPARETEVEVEGSNSGLVFDLDADELAHLISKAEQGDGDAAFRIANFYSISGGGFQRANDPRIEAATEKWLRLAADNGHETAKFNLAVHIGRKDCEGAQAILRTLIETASDEELRSHAISWLDEGSGLCGRD